MERGFAGDIVTAGETGKLLKVVPERDGHRIELQWAVAPECKTYKVFPCSYLRSALLLSPLPLALECHAVFQSA